MQYFDNYQINFEKRNPAKGVDPLFYKRWSPRSFKKNEIPEDVLLAIFDAARWAPSCYNEQPWVFLTSSGKKDFDLFLSLLLESNQTWACNCSLIGFILGRKKFTANKKDNPWSSFDCGAAWMSMTLQARKYGLYTHGMAGIKKEEIYKTMDIPKDDYKVICGFTLGIIEFPDNLSPELSAREQPSERLSLKKIWKKGGLK
ncbi:MAG: nitroreductase family protein [Candidatus Omnitrophica bacterium]|nr:nitroreductase family protein [Candidatus Omnitrophota bacterium]